MFLGFSPVDAGFLFAGNRIVYGLERGYLCLVFFDPAAERPGEVSVKCLIAFKLVAKNGIMRFLRHVFGIDGKYPSVDKFERKADHLTLFSVCGNHHPEGDSWSEDFVFLKLEVLCLICDPDSIADGFNGDENVMILVAYSSYFYAVDGSNYLFVHILFFDEMNNHTANIGIIYLVKVNFTQKNQRLKFI